MWYSSTVKVGKNNQLKHYGLGVVIHPYAVIHDNVTIYQQVTLGSRYRKPCYITTLAEGTSVGAQAFIKQSTETFWIYAGTPARRIKERSRDFVEQYNEYFNIK